MNTTQHNKKASAPETRTLTHDEAMRTPGTPEHADGQRRLMEAIFPERKQWDNNADELLHYKTHAEALAEALRLALAFCENDAMNRPKINPMASISQALAAYEKEAR